MTQQKQHLEMIIQAHENQKQMGNLSQQGIDYLQGLKQAHKIIFGEQAMPQSAGRAVFTCPSCQSSNIQEGSQFHKCLSCGNIFV